MINTWSLNGGVLTRGRDYPEAGSLVFLLIYTNLQKTSFFILFEVFDGRQSEKAYFH